MATRIGGILANLEMEISKWRSDLGKATTLLNSSSARMNVAIDAVNKRWSRMERGLRNSMRTFGLVTGGAGLALLTRSVFQAGLAVERMENKYGRRDGVGRCRWSRNGVRDHAIKTPWLGCAANCR